MFRSICISAGAAIMLGLSFQPAHALANRPWLSGHGTDAAGCGAPSAPCRSFQYVHDNIIAPGGEIDVLDPAGYGAVTITKGLSIVNDGVGTAGVQQANANASAITITAGATDKIHLLNIDGLGVAGRGGVVVNSAGVVEIVGCVVRHFTGDAINVSPASGTLQLYISDTLISNNTGGSAINVFPVFGSATIQGVIKRVTLNDNLVGVSVIGLSSGRVDMTVVDSTAAGNTQGFVAESPVSVANTTLMLEHVTASGNTTGVNSTNKAIIRVARSTVTRNATGIFLSGAGVVESFGDNVIRDNTTNASGPLTPVGLQ